VKNTVFKEIGLARVKLEGRVINSTEKTYDVVLIGGWPFDRLFKFRVRSCPRQKSESRIKKRRSSADKLQAEIRKRSATRKRPGLRLNCSLRYHFRVISNDVCQDRKAVVLAFNPKTDNPEKTVEDRILNRFAGLLWVDSEDAEVAKLMSI